MKVEKEIQAEKIILIDIKLTRGLVAALVVALTLVTLISYQAIGGSRARAAYSDAPQAASDGMRKYYLKAGFFDGMHAISACDSGYHFASLWEILDPSNLQYNNTLGYNRLDSGQGPPARTTGFVRTGYDGHVLNAPGDANCDNWSSDSSGEWGSSAGLEDIWTTGGEMHVWDVSTRECDSIGYVWCVED